MADSNSGALVATFFFGIVLLAASGTILLYVKGNASTFFRDELRLALVFFMINSSLWGLLGFIATLVSTNAESGCQIVIAFAAAFDQLARISIEQFLLWGTNGGVKLSKTSIAVQVAIFLRFILGAVFVGVQRPQFRPVCVASNLVLPVGVVVIVIDALMAIGLSIKACSVGNSRVVRKARPGLADSKALLYITVALGIWTGMSIPLLIGLQSSSLAVRTVVPAIGLLIVIGVVALFARSITSSIIAPQLSPKAPSIDSFPPTELPARAFQPRGISPQYQEMDGGSATLNPVVQRLAEPPRGMVGALPIISQPPAGQAVEGIGGMPIEGKLFPPMRSQTAPVGMELPKRQLSRKDLMKGGKLAISKPVRDETVTGTAFDKIATVDLATAAMKERERRDMAPQPAFSNVGMAQPEQLARAMSPEDMRNQLPVSKRKQLPETSAPNDAQTRLAPEQPEIAMTSAVQLSPGVEETRRRSPRRPPSEVFSPSDILPPAPLKDAPTPDMTTPTLHVATAVMVPPPRSPRRPPPINPLELKSPRLGNEMTRSLLDPRTPPAIPIIPLKNPERRESKRISGNAGSRMSNDIVSPLSPLVPRLQPSVLSPVEPEPELDSMLDLRPEPIPEPTLEPIPEPIPEPELDLESEPIPEPEPMPEPIQELKVEPKMEPQLQRQLSNGSAATSSGQNWSDSRKTLLPRNGSVRVNIRPSRQRPPSIPTAEDKPTKTPVQMRATAGLPRNPRAQVTKVPTIKVSTDEQGVSQDRTVMFVNNLDDNVTEVDENAGKVTEPSSLVNRDSVMHRPRPIPRKHMKSGSILDDISLPVFPEKVAEPETQSPPTTSNVMSSVVPIVMPEAVPETKPEAELEAIPEPAPIPKVIPQEAPKGTNQKTPLISPVSVQSPPARNMNDTTSPAISPSRRRTVKRTSFVPELPALPVEYQGQQPKITQESVIDGTKNARTVVPNSQERQITSPEGPSRTQCLSKFSMDTSLSPDEPQSAFSRLSVHTKSSCEETIGRSSGVIIVSDARALAESPASTPDTPEIPDADFGLTPKPAPVALKTAIVGEKHVTTNAEEGKTATVPMMLDTSNFPKVPPGRGSLSSEDSGSSGETKQNAWHHRIGEELPSFSGRKKTKRSRKLSPPKPLSLDKPTRVPMIVKAEPSPLESPQQALDKIQEQLMQFDAPNADSRATISEQQRMTILASLESEMGMQESHWQKMRQNLAGASPSTVKSSPNIESVRNSLRSVDLDGDVRNSRHLRGEKLYRLSTGSDRSSQLSKEDFLEGRTNRLSTSASGRMSLLSVTSRTMAQLGSPTPPDTDESGNDSDTDNTSNTESFSEVDDRSTGVSPGSQAIIALALDQALRDEIASQPRTLADVPEIPIVLAVASPSDNRVSIKSEPEQKPNEVPVAPAPKDEIRASVSPSSMIQPPQRPSTRPLTLRPPRRSKRITLLPDILESPKPIAGKRDTLGIFRFPWGERSDSATAQPKFAPMPGTMASRGPWMGPPVMYTRTLPQESRNEGPGPIFEAYSDSGEYADSSDGSYDDDGYDDGFDEATLWEIASLLKTDEVPSREEPLPTRENSWDEKIPNAKAVDDAETDSEGTGDETAYDFIPMTLISEAVSIRVVRVPTLWTRRAEQVQVKAMIGLPQPEEKAWMSYIPPAAPRAARARPQMEEPAAITSVSLWPSDSTEATELITTGLWSMRKKSDALSLVVQTPKDLQTPQELQTPRELQTHRLLESENSNTFPDGENRETKRVTFTASIVKSPTTPVGLLWSSPVPIKDTPTGLQQPDVKVWNKYLPPATRTVRQTVQAVEAPSLESISLWSTPQETQETQGSLWCSAKPLQKAIPSIQASKPAQITVMWSHPVPSKETAIGLQQPDPSVWNTYLPPASRIVRPKTQMSEAVKLQSLSLWVTPKESHGVQGLLWASKKPAKLPSPVETNIHVRTEPTVTRALWSQPAPRKSAIGGLPQPDAKTWNAYIPPASQMVRPKSRNPEVPMIESRSLWTAPKEVHVSQQLLWCPAKPQSLTPEQVHHEIEGGSLQSSFEEDSESETESEYEETVQPEPISSGHTERGSSSGLVSPRTQLPPTGLTFTQDWLKPPTMPPRSPSEASSVYSDDGEDNEDEDTTVEDNNSPSTPNTASNANRQTMPIFMTRDQWNSAFKEAVQETKTVKKRATQAAWATEDEWAATLNNASSPAPPSTSFSSALNTFRQLSSSHAMKDHPFFDPSVLSIVSDYTKKPIPGSTNTNQEPTNTRPVPVNETPKPTDGQP